MQKDRLFRTIVAASLFASVSHGAYTWQSVQFRGGGYVPEVAFHPSAGGPAYARTDIGGAYRLDANRKDWIPLNDMFTDANDMGSIAIGLDPDDTNYVYLTGGLYTGLSWCGSASLLRSSDRGASWTKIVLGSANISGANSAQLTSGGTACLAGNGTGRGMGPRLAVKGAKLFLGTNQNGLLRSTDRGNTWTTIAALGDTTGVGSVLFDAAGNVYAAPSSGGLWTSADGVVWTQIAGLSDVVYQMKYSQSTNTIWLTANKTSPQDQGGTGGGSVWTYDVAAQSFAQVTMPSKAWNGYTKDFGYGAVAVDPTNASHVIVVTNGWWRGNANPRTPSTFVPSEAMYRTVDGGKNWSDILLNGKFDTVSAAWAASSNPGWITALAIDPANSDHVIFGTGGGVWSTTNATAASPTWLFTDKGLEETAPMGLVSSTAGAPLVSVMGDVNGAYHESVSVPPAWPHQVDVGTNFDISMAGLAPNKMIRIYQDTSKGEGGWSQDGGKTWTQFAAFPPTVIDQWGGSSQSNFAAISADGSSIVRNMQQNGVYWSKDNGATWTKSVTDASLLCTADAGFRVLADRAAAGVFYIYNPQTGVFYRSLDDGANWTAMKNMPGHGDSWAWQYYRAFVSPKAAGEVWFTQGSGGIGQNIVYRSTDSGKTLTTITSLKSATTIGFGKGLTPAVPAIYVYGTIAAGTTGLFRSTDDGATWTQIDDAAHKYGGMPLVVGDPCIFSRVYVGGGAGRGILYAQEPNSANSSCTDRADYSTSGIRPLGQTHRSGLSREGSSLIGDAQAVIRLTDLEGRLIQSARGTLVLGHLPRGVYLATDGVTTLRVPVTR
jgi:hypothetical protein